MKKIKYILVLIIITITACSNKNEWCINIHDWNVTTMKSIKLMNPDTSFYTNMPLELIIDSTIIRSFYNHINYFIRNRNSIVSIIKHSLDLKSSDTLYVIEQYKNGGYDNCDFRFIVCDDLQNPSHNLYEVNRNSINEIVIHDKNFSELIDFYRTHFLGYREIVQRIEILSMITRDNDGTHIEVQGIAIH